MPLKGHFMRIFASVKASLVFDWDSFYALELQGDNKYGKHLGKLIR